MGQAVWPVYTMILGGSFLAAFFLTPLIRKGALKLQFVDPPRERRVHKVPLPLGGGVGIYLAFWLAVWAFIPWRFELWGWLVASTGILLLGLIDDKWELSWHVKLVGQFLAAGVLVYFGERIEFVTNPLAGESMYIGAWGIPLTLLWLVALTNMINWIDGLDGLAAGVCAIACVPLFLVAVQKGRIDAALLTVALFGATVGFLPFNFNPARIIMGDAGAMLLGFSLGAISVDGALKGATAIALTVPVLALGLPITETLFSIFRRLASGRPVYVGDADHLHHRLLAMGLSQRQAVLTLYGVSALMAASALIAFDAEGAGSLGVFALVAIGSVAFAHRIGGLKGAHMTRRTRKETHGL